MKGRIQKWKNSLTLRIPRADDVNLRENSAVDVFVRDRSLVVSPIADDELTLDALVDEITTENRYGELGAGEAVGREVW